MPVTNPNEEAYLGLLNEVLHHGHRKDDRTGTGTYSLFGKTLTLDLTRGFPLLTTKQVNYKAVFAELCWMIRGETNVGTLVDEDGKHVGIWNNWRRPWPKARPLVEVTRRRREYVPYDGDFSVAGLDGARGTVDEKLANAWVRMMKRCYDPSAHNYQHYGAQGVSVASRWHDVRSFVEDVKLLPHWSYKHDDWNTFELDKDYYGSYQYGPDTCIWLPRGENINTSVVCIKTPEGRTQCFWGYADASSSTGLSRTSLHRFVTEGVPTLLKGNNKKAAGWSFWEYDESDNVDVLLRPSIVESGDLGPVYGKQWRAFDGEDGQVDQLADLERRLQEDPDDRRLMVSAWNPAQIHDMALPPCHLLFQVYTRVDEGGHRYLSLQVYQRSADLFIGVPFNVASYAALAQLLAYRAGMVPEHLIFSFGDAHVYRNHEGAVLEQLGRAPMKPPEFELIGRQVKEQDLTTVARTPAMFQVRGYDPHPAIPAPVAV